MNARGSSFSVKRERNDGEKMKQDEFCGNAEDDHDNDDDDDIAAPKGDDDDDADDLFTNAD